MKNFAKNTLGALVAASLLAGLCILGQSAAQAKGTGAIHGSPASGSEAHCFTEVYGGVRNGCNASKYFVLPALLDDAGWLEMKVGARGVRGSGNLVRCQAWSTSNYANRFRSGSVAETREHTGGAEHLEIQVRINGWGATYAYCRMDPGTQLLNYHY